MSWVEVSSVITGSMAIASVVLSGLAYRRSGVQDLPRVDFWRSWTSGGQRGIIFDLEQLPGQPDWVIDGASVRWNWRHRQWLAHGQERFYNEYFDGEPVNRWVPATPWEHRVKFDPPKKHGGVMLHPDAPDCQVTLRITLSTSPSPTVVRHVTSKKRNI